ncbi:hypothetical protein LUQ84_002240 [Hamiltosporidium tvaerminnensis]|nr:hypothetical protein LUQ84_002240 [Hamiltosporidium tvaerminnensis]
MPILARLTDKQKFSFYKISKNGEKSFITEFNTSNLVEDYFINNKGQLFYIMNRSLYSTEGFIKKMDEDRYEWYKGKEKSYLFYISNKILWKIELTIQRNKTGLDSVNSPIFVCEIFKDDFYKIIVVSENQIFLFSEKTLISIFNSNLKQQEFPFKINNVKHCLDRLLIIDENFSVHFFMIANNRIEGGFKSICKEVSFLKVSLDGILVLYGKGEIFFVDVKNKRILRREQHIVEDVLILNCKTFYFVNEEGIFRFYIENGKSEIFISGKGEYKIFDFEKPIESKGDGDSSRNESFVEKKIFLNEKKSDETKSGNEEKSFSGENESFVEKSKSPRKMENPTLKNPNIRNENLKKENENFLGNSNISFKQDSLIKNEDLSKNSSVKFQSHFEENFKKNDDFLDSEKSNSKNKETSSVNKNSINFNSYNNSELRSNESFIENANSNDFDSNRNSEFRKKEIVFEHTNPNNFNTKNNFDDKNKFDDKNNFKDERFPCGSCKRRIIEIEELRNFMFQMKIEMRREIFALRKEIEKLKKNRN